MHATEADQYQSLTIEQRNDQLKKLFSHMINLDSAIDQIRYIDKKREELIRINNKNGQVEVIFDKKLSKKFLKDYFKETMKLKNEQVYISNIELNFQDGKIETPYKPIVRFATLASGVRYTAMKTACYFPLTLKKPGLTTEYIFGVGTSWHIGLDWNTVADGPSPSSDLVSADEFGLKM